MFSDCQSPNNQYNPGYQVVNSPNGGQVVVIKNDDGSDFFMDYLIFQSLMNSGGIGGVRNYYGQHRYEPNYMNQQNQYKNQYKSVVHNHYYNSSGNSQSTNTQKSQQPEVKYRPSSGFSNTSSTSTQNNNASSNEVNNGVNSSTQSKGFSQKYFKPDVPTKTQPPVYKPSSGFSSTGSTSTKSNSNPYNQSKGFGKKN